MENNPFGFEIPNLDDTRCTNDSFAAYVETARVLDLLAKYMRHKAAAISARRNGKIQVAINNETKCESFYNQLPKWAKW